MRLIKKINFTEIHATLNPLEGMQLLGSHHSSFFQNREIFIWLDKLDESKKTVVYEVSTI